MNTTDHTSLKLGAAVIAATMIAVLGVLYAFYLHVVYTQWGVVLGTVIAMCEVILARSIRRPGLLLVLSAALMALWASYMVVVPLHGPFLVVMAWFVPYVVVSELLGRGIKKWVLVRDET